MPTPTQITKHAKATIDAARAIKSAYALCKQLMNYNSVNDPGWGSLETDPPVNAETGIIDGTEVAPGDISNALGSITNFLHFYEGTADVAQSAWGNNLEKITDPIV